MERLNALKVFFVVWAIIFSCPCKAQKVSEILHSRISELMKEYDAIGLSVLAVKDNKICYQESFGYNDSEKRTLIKNDDIFRIASVSKTFVATAIMQLVEKGEIRLDDDISQYLNFKIRNPYYPQDPITVRMLLNHHSSITDYQYGKHRNSLAMFRPDSPNLKFFFGNYKPGVKYKYSNYGYSLLGAIIENVTKERFDTYIDNNILIPLGIRDGSYNVSKVDSSKFVWAYQYNEKNRKFVKSSQMYKPFRKEIREYKLGESTAVFAPAGGMKLSVPDLAKYMMMHMNYGTYNGVKILTRESEELLWKITSNKYGLGFAHSSCGLKGVDMIGHQGGAYGIHSEMFFNPRDKYGFIVICNGNNSGHALGSQIIRELYNYFIE